MPFAKVLTAVGTYPYSIFFASCDCTRGHARLESLVFFDAFDLIADCTETIAEANRHIGITIAAQNIGNLQSDLLSGLHLFQLGFYVQKS